jgi:hypothetical protein
MKRPLDPHKTILILKHDGKEVGRVAATAPNANEYMEELGRHYKEIQETTQLKELVRQDN